ncbi:MAG: hypothetical protein IH820_14540 [Bacteroidetes bacterium]|nr:hypothetical protein [Bacteroidota bacterium]
MRHRYKGRHLVFMGCFLVLLMACFSVARAQESRTMNVGPLLYTTNEALTDDDIAWPTDRAFSVDRNRIQMLEANAIIIGVRRTWTDATGVTRDIQIAHRRDGTPPTRAPMPSPSMATATSWRARPAPTASSDRPEMPAPPSTRPRSSTR